MTGHRWQAFTNATFHLKADTVSEEAFAMLGRLSRNTAVCKRYRGFRVIILVALKSPQIALKNVVMSAFPTALEPALRRLSLGTNASPQPSDRKAVTLLAQCADVPRPPPVVVALGVCHLRLARICSSSYPSSSSRVQYGKAGENSFLVGSGS